jgi:hypothetical protein
MPTVAGWPRPDGIPLEPISNELLHSNIDDDVDIGLHVSSDIPDAAYMIDCLDGIGLHVRRRLACGDSPAQLVDLLDQSFFVMPQKSRIVPRKQRRVSVAEAFGLRSRIAHASW